MIRSAIRASLVGRARRHRDRLTDAGGARAAQDVVVDLGPEVSHPGGEGQGRQALVVAQAARRDVVREVRQERRRRWAWDGRWRCGRRSRTGGAGRSGRGSSCRTPRRPRSASAGGRGRRCTPGRRRSPPSPSRGGRPPRAGRRRRTACRAGRPAAGRRSARRRGPPSARGSRVRPRGGPAGGGSSRAGPRRCRRPAGPRSWTRIVPGASGSPIAANAAPPWRTIHGTAASVWTLLTTVGRPNRPSSVG